MRLVDTSGMPHAVLRLIAVFSLVVWTLDEIARGVNPFRRTLGGLVLLGVVLMLIGRR
jgi:hypothetical protein